MHLIPVQSKLDLAAGTAGILTFVPSPGETWRLISLDVVPDADVATNGTDYISLRPYKDHDTAAPLAAARVTSSTGLTQGTNVLYGETGSSPAPDIAWTTPRGTGMEFTRLAPLTLQVTHAGAGKAVKITASALFERLRAAA